MTIHAEAPGAHGINSYGKKGESMRKIDSPPRMKKLFFLMSRANPVFSPEYSSWGGWPGPGWFRDKRKKGEIHHVCGLPARVIPIRREFRGEYATARGGVRTTSGIVEYFDEVQAGPAACGPS